MTDPEPTHTALAAERLLDGIDWDAVLAEHRAEQDEDYWGESA